MNPNHHELDPNRHELDATHVSRRNKRKRGFRGGTGLPWRSAGGATTPCHHELNHGETGNCDPLWGLKPVMPVRPFHGGFGDPFMVIWAQFMVIWIHGDLLGGGARNSARYWTDTPTLAPHDLENPKD